jgi:hypothetical protein
VAKRREPVEKKSPARKAPATPAEQLAALSPDVDLVIAKRKLRFREYEFFEVLEVAHRSQAFFRAMHDLCRDGELRYDRIRRLFGVHRDVVVAIAAQCADVDAEWVMALSKPDKETFLSAWFSANASFFVHEVVTEIREERAIRIVHASTGFSASPGSPATGSATSTASDASPSGN